MYVMLRVFAGSLYSMYWNQQPHVVYTHGQLFSADKEKHL